jgi:hypothetical protein
VFGVCIVISGSNAWCKAKDEALWKNYKPKQEGEWKDYRKPFEEDILVSEVSTIRVDLPEEFFREDTITLSVTTDATSHSEPKIAVGTWEKNLVSLLTPHEYFTTLMLTETINLEIPTRHFSKGENDIKFYSISDRPEDQYIVTRLEFAAYGEKVQSAPESETLEKVRIGLLANLAGGSVRTDEEKYVDLLTDEIGTKSRCQVVPLKDPISYYNLDIPMARILSQRYRIQMVIGVENAWQHGRGNHAMTKLIDISAQRLVELEAVDIGHGYAGFRPGWQKRLVSKQIGPIERMIHEISQGKMTAREPEEMVRAAPAAPAQAVTKVRIGVLTELQKTLEQAYFDHLKAVLEKRDDCQPVLFLGPITHDAPYTEVIKHLKQKHQIDMIIYVGSRSYSTGEAFWTVLVDTSQQKEVELDGVYVPRENRYRWEKMVVKKQLEPIEEMIEGISQEKKASRLQEDND